MATLEQIAAALKAADAAGNVDDAKRLAAAYRQMQGASVAAPTMENASTPIPGGMTKFGEASSNMEWAAGSEPKPTFADEAMSFGRGVIEGIPVIGPTLSDWRQGLDANISALATGGNADEIKARYKAADEELRGKTGGARAVGNVTGSVAALAPLGMTQVGGRLLGMTGGFGSRLGFGVASGGALSGADALTRGATLGEAGMTALAGGALGAAFPLIGASFRRAISPVTGNASKAAAADVLRNEGVELTAGQMTGNKGLRFREAELGGNSAQDFMERQGRQFTAAALRRAGINADEASHDVIDRAFTDIGGQFDTLVARNAITPDQRLARDLQAGWRRFEGATGPSTRPRVIERLLADIYGQGNAGPISGAWYKAKRTELGKLTKSTNPELAEAARDFMEALDDAMERTLSQTNPNDLGAWREARRLYRNLIVIEDASTRAGAQSADGFITPQALRSAAMRQNKRAFSRGRNEFVNLADAGVSAMTPLPDSGTAGRLSAKAILPAGMAAGAGIGGTIGNIPGAILGGAIGGAVPWAVGRAMLSGPGRAYLSNQAMAGGRALPALPPALLPLELTKKRKPVEIEVRGGAL